MTLDEGTGRIRRSVSERFLEQPETPCLGGLGRQGIGREPAFSAENPLRCGIGDFAGAADGKEVRREHLQLGKVVVGGENEGIDVLGRGS